MRSLTRGRPAAVAQATISSLTTSMDGVVWIYAVQGKGTVRARARTAYVDDNFAITAARPRYGMEARATWVNRSKDLEGITIVGDHGPATARLRSRPRRKKRAADRRHSADAALPSGGAPGAPVDPP